MVYPTLAQLRALNRDNITARLNSGAMIPNSVLRVMSDANAGLAYLTLLYLNWLSNQLLPDTAETTFLDRFASIWLKNFGGGRKTATFASGSVLVTGISGTVIPLGTQFSSQSGSANVIYQSTAQVTIGSTPTHGQPRGSDRRRRGQPGPADDHFVRDGDRRRQWHRHGRQHDRWCGSGE